MSRNIFPILCLSSQQRELLAIMFNFIVYFHHISEVENNWVSLFKILIVKLSFFLSFSFPKLDKVNIMIKFQQKHHNKTYCLCHKATFHPGVGGGDSSGCFQNQQIILNCVLALNGWKWMWPSLVSWPCSDKTIQRRVEHFIYVHGKMSVKY